MQLLLVLSQNDHCKITNNSFVGSLLMFTGKPLPPMHPLLEDEGWAEGRVHWCTQSALRFGADRSIAVAARPIVTLRRDGGRAVALPCTSRDQSLNSSFRELVSPRDLLWVAGIKQRRTFAFRRYETVGLWAIGSMLGFLNHSARIDLLKWVKERY